MICALLTLVNNAPQITILENEWEPEPELDLQMRDPVVVVAPGRLHNSVGVITGIEGDLCRFHVKVRPTRAIVLVYLITISLFSRTAGTEKEIRPVDSS